MKKGWQAKKLREVCELVNGRAYSKPELLAAGKYRVLRVGNFFTNDHWYYSDMELEEKKYCDTGDLLYAWSASFGPRMWTGGKVIYHYHIWKVVHDRSQIVQKFLFYFFQWDTEKIKEDQGTGTTMMHVSMGSMNERDIQLPPLAEQQWIVGLLDEAFEGLATAKANAEKNLQNARTLFESYLQSVFTKRGPGWVEKSLGEVCVVKDGTHDSPKYVTDGIPFVTQKNIREDGLSFERIKFISQEDHDDFYRRSNAAHGDILISMIGANRGMACIVDDERTFSIKNVGLVKQNPSINQEFLLYFLKSPQAAGFVKGASKGGAQEFVGLTELRRFPVPLPPLERQNALAETFQSLREETQRLARLYERKLAALEALKKSLLHQAFSGEL